MKSESRRRRRHRRSQNFLQTLTQEQMKLIAFSRTFNQSGKDDAADVRVWVLSCFSRVWLFENLSCFSSCLTLCDTVDCSPPGFSVHGTSQARIWNGLLCPHPGDLPDPEIKPMPPPTPAPALQADSLPLSHQGSLLLPTGTGKGK